MSQELLGQVAIISGGGGDIGAACAVELARRGADVALGDIASAERAQEVVARVETAGRRCRYATVDVSDAAAVSDWIDDVATSWQVPEIAIGTAAVVTMKGLEAISFSEWDREFAVNLHGYFYFARTVANRLAAAGKPGRIALIGSAAADGVTMSLPTYCITKAAIRKLTECLAATYAGKGILVNDVAPGMVDAGLSAAAMRENPELRKLAEKIVPTGQMASAEDIALEVVRLCSPSNRHLTGSTVYVDGGMRLKIIAAYD